MPPRKGQRGRRDATKDKDKIVADGTSASAASAGSSGEAPVQPDVESVDTDTARANSFAAAKTIQCAGSSGEAPCEDPISPSAAEPDSAETVTENLEPVASSGEPLGSSGEAPCETEAPELVAANTDACVEAAEQAGSSGEAPCEESTPGPADSEDATLVAAEQNCSSGEAPLNEQPPEETVPSGEDGNVPAVPLEAGHGGGSGEAPLQEADADAAKAEAQATGVGAESFECSWDISGDYRWANPSEEVECILRVRQTGEWWHAAHRSSTERGRIVDPKAPKKQQGPVDIRKAYKEHDFEEESSDLKQHEGNYHEFSVWEMAETTGSWRQVQIWSGVEAEGEEPPAALMGVLLTCQLCSWKSNFPNAPLVYTPSEDGQAEVDSMLESGQLVLCFVYRPEDESGGSRLELHMDLSTVFEWTGDQVQSLPRHARLRSVQTAFQTLGFAREYAGQRKGQTIDEAQPIAPAA